MVYKRIHMSKGFLYTVVCRFSTPLNTEVEFVLGDVSSRVPSVSQAIHTGKTPKIHYWLYAVW